MAFEKEENTLELVRAKHEDRHGRTVSLDPADTKRSL
jgi:hypothetical protein